MTETRQPPPELGLYAFERVHISEIRHGDAILHRGELKTIGRQWIKNSLFMGISIYGDTYMLGTKPVVRAAIGAAGRMVLMQPETRHPVTCASCGWKGKRMTGKPVDCPKCGAWATFDIDRERGEG